MNALERRVSNSDSEDIDSADEVATCFFMKATTLAFIIRLRQSWLTKSLAKNKNLVGAGRKWIMHKISACTFHYEDYRCHRLWQYHCAQFATSRSETSCGGNLWNLHTYSHATSYFQTVYHLEKRSPYLRSALDEPCISKVFEIATLFDSGQTATEAL